MRITCEFGDLPEKIVLDASNQTSLKNEYLLSSDGTLMIQKTYDGSLATPKVSSITALATHPTAEKYNDLLSLKNSDLKKRAGVLEVNLSNVDERANANLRAAIWNSSEELALKLIPVPLNAEDGKKVWTVLLKDLPVFALFKSDRASTDQDSEAQDPLKAAIQEALKAVGDKLKEVTDHVETEVNKIAAATVGKLREMDPALAETLNPNIETKRWDSLFKTSITGDEGIPLNKRGSGTRRLVLLNFFRAKAEKDASENNTSSVIYAIEEPETSQHPRNQRLIISAFRDLAVSSGRQVIVTTHNPGFARLLPASTLRFISKNDTGTRTMSDVGSDTLSESDRDDTLRQIATSLGVLPDHNVKAFIGVEGPNDIFFLQGMAELLRKLDKTVPDLKSLEDSGEIIFIPLSGTNLAHWTSRLAPLNRPELFIFDRDEPPDKPPKYEKRIKEINMRNKQSDCQAVATNKREMENYLHPDAICDMYKTHDINITMPTEFGDTDDVPALVAKAVHEASKARDPWDDLTDDKPWDDLTDDKRGKKNLVSNIGSIERYPHI